MVPVEALRNPVTMPMRATVRQRDILDLASTRRGDADRSGPRRRWSGVRSRHSVCVGRQFGRVSRRPRAPPRPSGLGGHEPGTSKLPQGGKRLCGPQSKPPIRRPWGIGAGATGAAPVGGTIKPVAQHLASACTARAFRVATVSVVGRLRPGARPRPRADPPAGAGGTYRAGRVQNRRGGGYCSGLLRGDGNCSCSRHGAGGIVALEYSSHPCFKVIRFAPSGAWVLRLIPVLSPGRWRAGTS